jgi:hypothetical protein
MILKMLWFDDNTIRNHGVVGLGGLVQFDSDDCIIGLYGHVAYNNNLHVEL